MVLLKDNLFFKNKKIFLSSIKSYVNRRRRVGEKKKQYILKYWKTYGMSFHYSFLNMSSLFSINQQVILEIGFGNGKQFIEKALRNPHVNFIGIEVYLSGIFSAIRYANIYCVSNIKIIFYDAFEVLSYMVPDHTIDMLQIFFPDPWHKKKHHKRRLINKSFMNLLEKKIVYGGSLHIITDCKSYSDNIRTIISTNNKFKRIFCEKNISPLLGYRKKTKFEKKAMFMDHTIFDYKYQLCFQNNY
ncbi:tRNA (guanosine(46)-N7)-methyltransferase TrmB [Buchnera aphidicola]|uniref:tRNA (guanosine(46)-N7)-methyltransferase TrmB n=1 Tax=Buchnera aphidicola TaxID=9 RepID=UPI00094D4E1B|nr:tRNA (guanosine(46)-N7)-methyltransferase TrmB [Buchnera aphidicola]